MGVFGGKQGAYGEDVQFCHIESGVWWVLGGKVTRSYRSGGSSGEDGHSASVCVAADVEAFRVKCSQFGKGNGACGGCLKPFPESLSTSQHPVDAGNAVQFVQGPAHHNTP